MDFATAFAIVGKALGAGLCMGIGAIGPALGEGNAVSHALEGMARQPDRNHRYLCSADLFPDPVRSVISPFLTKQERSEIRGQISRIYRC